MSIVFVYFVKKKWWQKKEYVLFILNDFDCSYQNQFMILESSLADERIKFRKPYTCLFIYYLT